jgi:hypothetical protein
MVIFDVQPSYRRCLIMNIGGFLVLCAVAVGLMGDFIPYGAALIIVGTIMFGVGFLRPPERRVKG